MVQFLIFVNLYTMARRANINNDLLRRFERAGSEKRLQNVRNKIAYFLIVCEGEKTEPNYFKSFKNKNVTSYVCEMDIHGEGRNTLGLVKECIKIRENEVAKGKNYDRVWVVFDRDSFKPEHFDNAIKRAKANDIKCAWSNEAFELWYLLHFDSIEHGMRRDEYKTALERRIRKAVPDFVYQKNNPNMYDILEKFGNQKLAIKRAKKLEDLFDDLKYHNHNPRTTVYALVEELNGDSDKLIKELERNKN